MAIIVNNQKAMDLNNSVKENIELVNGEMELRIISTSDSGYSSINTVPQMTSNIAPSPYVISASSIFSSAYDAFKAFNGSSQTDFDRWASGYNNNVFPQWIKIDLGTMKKINKYTLKSVIGSDQTQLPKAWLFEGSNNNVDFHVIHSIENAATWGTLEKRTFEFTNNIEYRYYRITITENHGGTICALGDIELMENQLLNYYYNNGVAELAVVDLGHYFKEISTVSTMKNIPNGTEIKIHTSTSSDMAIFSEWSLVDGNGNITSPQARYIKVKIEFIGNSVESNIKLNDFTSDEASKFEENEFIKFDNNLKLKVSYNTTANKDTSWTEDGSLYKYDIDKNKFKFIKAIEVI